MFNNCTKIVSETRYKVKQGKGLKILSFKQMLQTLPIPLAQVKAGSTFWRLTKWSQTN